MCVIAVSPIGKRQPSQAELVSMWATNPHGAGYMCARRGKLYIHKGFMFLSDFLRAVRMEQFTAADPVVYHFRIATSGGRSPEMTHPFPVAHDMVFEDCKLLDVSAPVGIAHNGVIPFCTIPKSEYSDTAIFTARYISQLITDPSSIHNPEITEFIVKNGGFSRFALMNRNGEIETIGDFTSVQGLLVSNTYYMHKVPTTVSKGWRVRA